MRGTAGIAKLGNKLRGLRLRWYGHVRRKEEQYVGRRVMGMALPGRRRRGIPKRQCMDVVREDIRVKEVVEENAEDRVVWRTRMRCGDPE